jgi:hypothetical protein
VPGPYPARPISVRRGGDDEPYGVPGAIPEVLAEKVDYGRDMAGAVHHRDFDRVDYGRGMGGAVHHRDFDRFAAPL